MLRYHHLHKNCILKTNHNHHPLFLEKPLIASFLAHLNAYRLAVTPIVLTQYKERPKRPMLDYHQVQHPCCPVSTAEGLLLKYISYQLQRTLPLHIAMLHENNNRYHRISSVFHMRNLLPYQSEHHLDILHTQ